MPNTSVVCEITEGKKKQTPINLGITKPAIAAVKHGMFCTNWTTAPASGHNYHFAHTMGLPYHLAWPNIWKPDGPRPVINSDSLVLLVRLTETAKDPEGPQV